MNHAVSGTINIKSCFGISWAYTIYYRFAENSVVYLTGKAKKGILEKIGIKRVYFVDLIPMYIDTLNAIYSEDDLCTKSEAIILATDYYLALKAKIEAELSKYTC